jgi:hypothetical protein
VARKRRAADMDPLITQVIVAGVLELVMAPILVFLLKRGISSRLDVFDEKREMAREERAEDKKREHEQRKAERAMILAIARTMLLDNYEKCVSKGFYSVEEREVYSLLHKSYREDGGNGVIETIAERIRKLPLEPPDDKE